MKSEIPFVDFLHWYSASYFVWRLCCFMISYWLSFSLSAMQTSIKYEKIKLVNYQVTLSKPIQYIYRYSLRFNHFHICQITHVFIHSNLLFLFTYVKVSHSHVLLPHLICKNIHSSFFFSFFENLIHTSCF